jgi:hypothetical protein
MSCFVLCGLGTQCPRASHLSPLRALSSLPAPPCSPLCLHPPLSGSSIIHDRQALMLVDMASPKWAIFLVNGAWQKVTGISQEMAVGSHFWDLFEPPVPAQVRVHVAICLVWHVPALPTQQGRWFLAAAKKLQVCMAMAAITILCVRCTVVCPDLCSFAHHFRRPCHVPADAGASLPAGDRAAPQL